MSDRGTTKTAPLVKRIVELANGVVLEEMLKEAIRALRGER